MAWTNILQKEEENIWKQCTALLALMQILAVPYNRCEHQKIVFFFFIIWDTADDNSFFLLIRHQFWLIR